MKKIFASLAVLACLVAANAAVTNLFPNGDFGSPAGEPGPWLEAFGGGTTTYSYPTTGGNPGGYGVMNNSSGWGIWVGGATNALPLSSLGLTSGGTYDFVMDMRNLSGSGIGKLKVESWAGGVMLESSGELSAGSQSGSWVTYSFPVTLHPSATGIKVVPVAGAGSAIGYDNLGVVVPDSVLTVSITSPANGAVLTPNFTIAAAVTPGAAAVTNVNFYDGAMLLGNDASAPYTCNLLSVAPGAHALAAVAQDSGGNSATSAVVNVTVSNLPPPGNWQLVWSDEFNGTGVDTGIWTFETGNGSGGWGNNERQFYTSRTNNARVADGVLHIIARQESFGGFPYTSARIKTAGKYSKKYGRIEFRSKLPPGLGCWPANWMMPETSAYGGWAASGEIDVMESRGSDLTKVEGTIHYGGSWPDNTLSGADYTLPDGGLTTNFHTYMVEWNANSLKWFVDGALYQTQTNWYTTGYPYPAPFDQPFYLIMNLAIGGNYLGNPSDSAISSGTPFPVEMQVDYVRVYEYVPGPPSPPAGLTASPGDGRVYLAWDASGDAGTAFLVKRSTASGGPYTTVGSALGNEYTDIGLDNCSAYYYVIAATNSLGASADSSEVPALLGSFAVAVNSGGSVAGNFSADAYVSGGTIAALSSAAIDTSGLQAPAPQAVYQAERYGDFTYTFAGLISGASYRVRLHSAETYWSAVGQRRFNVVINGDQVLTDFDIIATAGAPNKAVINEFDVTAAAGRIVVDFVTVTDNARSSGIEILLPSLSSPNAGNNGPLWEGMTLNLTASTIPGATYQWTGPNGFTSIEQNPSIAGVTTNQAGLYAVAAISSTCTSAPAPTSVIVNPPPRLGIGENDGRLILSWPVGTLQSATNLSGPWGNVSGAISPHTNPGAAALEFYRLMMP